MLIERKANVNAVDDEGCTPLHYVAAMDNEFGGHEDWTEDDSLSNSEFHFFNFESDLVQKC